MTVSELIKSALYKIGVADQGPVPAEEQDEALKVLNTMLDAWSERYAPSYFTTYDSIDATLMMNAISTEAAVWNLAVLLAPNYDKTPNPIVISKADTTFKIMVRPQVEVSDTSELAALATNKSSYDITRG